MMFYSDDDGANETHEWKELRALMPYSREKLRGLCNTLGKQNKTARRPDLSGVFDGRPGSLTVDILHDEMTAIIEGIGPEIINGGATKFRGDD